VQIIFVSPQRYSAQHIFNANAYPIALRSVVDSCASRYALLLLHTSTLRAALERDLTDFRKVVEGQRVDLERAIESRPDFECVAVYDGLAHLAEMHSALNSLKSFLDVYAKLIGKLVNSSNNWSFGKATVDGQEASGGRLVNALRSSSVETLARLADLTLEHSRTWISDAVRYRDQLSHRSDLDNMHHMQLPLHNSTPHINFDEIERPVMPNGQDLGDYVDGILRNMAAYVRASIELLPNVDRTLITYSKMLGEQA
jgi:hypothetical protein